MKNIRSIWFCVVLLGAPLFGQTSPQVSPDTAPQPAVYAPALSAPGVEASVGYAYDMMFQPFATRVELIGVNGQATMQFTRRWGGTADFTFMHVGNVLQTPHSDDVFSALGGPVFYVMQREKTSVFVHALGGIAWVDSAVPVSSTAYFSGWESRFSYALGGGAERVISGPFAVRATADYQRTTFVNPGLGLQNQRNVRLTLGIAYRFGR